MTLPEKVDWQADTNVTAGQLRYNKTTREVSWEINWMPLDVGVLQADFAISITPETEDLDKILIIAGKLSAQAIDVVTDDTIVKEFKALSTDLEFDELAEGKGVVE